MKLAGLFVCLVFMVIQPKPDPIEKTVALFKQNNLPELYKMMAPNVDLTILDDTKMAAKEEAQLALNNFFSKKPVQIVKVVHKVDSNPAVLFAVLVLTCKNGTYRTSISFRIVSGTYLVDELRIEEEKSN